MSKTLGEMSLKEVDKKLKDYEHFIEERLKKDLKEIEVQLKSTLEKYNEWEELQHTTKMWRRFKDRDVNLLVPLNCGVNVNAVTDSYDTMLVNVGLNCFLEMNYDEADKYAGIRMRALQKQIDHYRQLAVNVKAQIKLVLLGMNELSATKVST